MARLGPFEVLETLAEGPKRTAHKARRAEADRPVRVVVCREPISDERFEAAARVTTPGVARLLSWGEHSEGGVWYETELPEGLTLEAVVARAPLPVPAALVAFDVILERLAAAHALGVTHGGIDAHTLVFTRDGPWLLDYGIADPRSDEKASPLPRPPGRAGPAARGHGPARARDDRRPAPRQVPAAPLRERGRSAARDRGAPRPRRAAREEDARARIRDAGHGRRARGPRGGVPRDARPRHDPHPPRRELEVEGRGAAGPRGGEGARRVGARARGRAGPPGDRGRSGAAGGRRARRRALGARRGARAGDRGGVGPRRGVAEPRPGARPRPRGDRPRPRRRGRARLRASAGEAGARRAPAVGRAVDRR